MCKEIQFTIVQHDCSKVYTGTTPVSIISVLNTSLVEQRPDQIIDKGFNERGYVENYFARNVADYNCMYLPTTQSLPVISGFIAILLVYNKTTQR